MGTVITANASSDAIMGDVTITLDRAKARGGKWYELAQKMLANSINLAGATEEQRRTAAEELRPLMAAVAAQDEVADRLIGQISDDCWNKIGRPAFDPTFDVVFPNGISYYTGGPDAEQPDRMDLLAHLLEMNVMLRLPAEDAKAMAAKLREASAAYRKVLAPVAGPRTRVQMYERAKTAVAHTAQIALAHLKRLYRAEGFTEAEIHAVIPDHPRKRPTVTEEPTPPAPATT